MTKPIIVVKVPCKLLYVIQVKEFLIKCSTSWPYLISEVLVAYITIVASDWPRTFLHPRCFCLAYRYRDILDNQDNFVVNIEIYFLALSHIPSADIIDSGTCTKPCALKLNLLQSTVACMCSRYSFNNMKQLTIFT